MGPVRFATPIRGTSGRKRKERHPIRSLRKIPSSTPKIQRSSSTFRCERHHGPVLRW